VRTVVVLDHRDLVAYLDTLEKRVYSAGCPPHCDAPGALAFTY
jgi:hypothetical protein